MFLKKRGQVTTFIILGIVIAIIIFVVFFFLGDVLLQKTRDKTPLERSQLIPIQQHIEECIQTSLDQTSDLLKRNAGYITTTNYFMLHHGANVNYLVYPDGAPNKANALSAVEGQVTVPSSSAPTQRVNPDQLLRSSQL